MPPWMVEELEKLKEVKEDNRLPLYIPIPMDKSEEDKDRDDSNRGVTIIPI